MKNKAHDLASYNFSKGEVVLLDTNVWLYLYPAPAQAGQKIPSSYSNALKAMMYAGVHFALDALVLSEYLNRYCRIEWEAQKTGMTFKQFRNTSNFSVVGANAVAFTNRIVKLCTRYDHPFASANLPQVLTSFQHGLCDFNDGLLADVCRQNSWKLITHDGDFTEGGIEILTSNHKLLAACK